MAMAVGMSKEQKDVLDRNLVTFCEELEVTVELLAYMVQHKVFRESHEEAIQNVSSKAQRRRDFIKTLKQRGPMAFDTFYAALTETGQWHLAQVLLPHLSHAPKPQHDPNYPHSKESTLHPWDPPPKEPNLDPKPTTLKPKRPIVNPKQLEDITAGYDDSQEITLTRENCENVLNTVLELNIEPSKEALAKNSQFYAGYANEQVQPTAGTLDIVVDTVDALPGFFDDTLVYKHFTQPKGLAIVFNNEEFSRDSGMPSRIGTNVDATNISKLLVNLGYIVKLKRNHTARHMLAAMARFAQKAEHSNCHSAVVVVLSHGGHGKIYGTDGYAVDVNQFVSYLNANSCIGLRNKPKLFFIQACRGDDYDAGRAMDAVDGPSRAINLAHAGASGDSNGNVANVVEQMADQDLADAEEIKRKIPTDADIFIAFATTPGYVSWRNSAKGSWLMQAIVQVFSVDGAREDLDSMMTKVKAKVAHAFESGCGHKQMPECVTRLTKKFYFFPGLTNPPLPGGDNS